MTGEAEAVFVPGVTVLTPWAGEHPEWLREAVASVPEGTPMIVAGNSGKNEMAEALNAALAKVTTPYVMILAADDRLEPDTILSLSEAIGTADVAYPTLVMFDDEQPGKELAEFRADWFCGNRTQDSNCCPGVFLAKTEALRGVGGWRDVVMEDWDLIWRLSQSGCRFQHAPQARYAYRKHTDSLSARISAITRESGHTIEDVAYQIRGERQSLYATFYCQASPGPAYLRGVLPARFLPGAARSTFDERCSHRSPVTVWQYPDSSTEPLIQRAREAGQLVIVDVDDNYLSRSLVPSLRFAPELASHWKRERSSHRRIVEQADAVICSTPELASTYAAVNANVHVCLNTVDAADWPSIERIPDGKLRVGWAAGRQHAPDARLVERAMRWCSRQANVEVVCIGLDPEWSFPYRHVPFTASLQVYRDVLSILDVGVAPILPGDMNRCKSDVKFLEYTMAGAATVATRSSAYAAVRDGETGLLAGTEKGFLDAVRTLVKDQDVRLGVSRQAARYVADYRSSLAMRPAYLAVMASVGVRAAAPEAVAA